MDWSYDFIILFSLLYWKIVSGLSENKLEKVCSVINEQDLSFQKESSFNISFFIRTEEPITFHVSFVGIKKHKNNDLLILRTEEARIQRKRDGEKTTYNYALRNHIPLGWNVMTITLEGDNLHFGNIYTLAGLKHIISDMSVTATYMTDCTNKTPTWEINEHKDVSIPLIGLSTFAVTLSGEEPFRPHLILNDFPVPLNYEDELYFGKSVDPLPANDYRIVIVKHTSPNMISIFTITKHGESKLLASTAINEDLVDLHVKTLGGDFHLILDPFLEDEYKVETTITKAENLELNNQEEITTSESETIHPPCAIESEVKGEAPSSTVWKVTTVLFAVIAAGSLFVHYYYYARNKKGKHQEVDTEEGEELLENQAKVSAKDKIKSEKTEPHGEFNPEFEYQKEICKLKLESDQNYRYKKTLGEFDESKQTKVILAVGETGSGKSSVINAMANFIYGIKYEDPFRFKLVDDMDKSCKIGINSTEKITAYYIPYTPGIANDSNYILIDTPGFGDLRGIDEDTKLVKKFYDFLKKNPDITEVDAICFVIKASDTRLTDIQKYIISGLFSMFGKDVIRNIYVVVSFSDDSETHVPNLLKDSGLKYDSKIHFNSNGLFNDGKEIKGLSEKEVCEYSYDNWNMTMTNINTFFSSLKMKMSVSLILTNIVLEENEDINKITDELLKLIEKEENSTDAEKSSIQERIEENQSLLMVKFKQETNKLSGRLKNITCKENPLVINDYIEILMRNAKDENYIIKLNKMKERNTIFQSLLSEKESTNYNFISYLFGEKIDKID